MAEASTSLSNAESLPPFKRRKIRRGTQSCWECKRRKTRCTFASPNESVCDGCRSRRVECVSQQFEYGLGTAERGEKMADRSQTDTGVERLVAFNDDDPRHSGFHVGGHAEGKTASSSSADAGPTTPQVKDKHDDLHRALLEVWPKQEDLDMILGASVSTSILFHGMVCVPYSSLQSQALPSPREVLQPPSPRSHPVLVARRLLLLATFMQGITEDAIQDLGSLSGRYKLTMSRLVEVSSKSVTSDDELVSSLEGIECIMIEAMYYNNAGNIRRAWVTHRRAMTIAQMLGLHRGAAPSAMMLDVRDRGRIDPEHMWYRLIISDRYLSLILGLPQGSLENPFGSPQALKGCNPLERLERLERMESIAGGLILQRNGACLHDLVKTQEIDQLLQEAAALMPPQWWLAPCVAAVVGNDSESLHQTIRLMNQFTHYHLLAQLHLPYLFRPSEERKYRYSKATAVMASREILTRFVSFRGSVSVAAYCKGIDLLAFIASTVLSLAHIIARRLQRVSEIDCDNTLHMVPHQRLSDRALLEHTLQCISRMAESGEDATACKISNILKRLLAIEDNVKDESCSATISSEPGELESQYGNNAFEAGHSLRIHIPYFGSIKIEHSTCIMSRSISVEQASLGRASRASSTLDSLAHDREGHPESPSQKHGKEKQEVRESLPVMSDPVGYRIGGGSVNTDWQRVPSHLDLLTTEEQSGTAALGRNVFDLGHAGVDTAALLVPGLTAEVDDWALQGVDMALFDNLIRGAAEPSADPSTD